MNEQKVCNCYYCDKDIMRGEKAYMSGVTVGEKIENIRLNANEVICKECFEKEKK